MGENVTAAEAAQTALSLLRESARRNKQASSRHRRAAQQDMAAWEALRRRCEAAGIEVIIEHTKPEA